MTFRVLFLIVLFSLTSALRSRLCSKIARLPVCMTGNEFNMDHKFDVLARDMELTESLRERIDGKIGKVMQKLGSDALSTSVVLRVINFPLTESHTHLNKKDSQIAEVTVQFKGGGVIHASQGTEDMYASIDLVAHKLGRALKKHSDKVKDKHQRERSLMKESFLEKEMSDDTFNIEDLLSDLDQKYKVTAVKTPSTPLNIIKPKKFAMPPISVDEAIAALDFIDHPFYVFRNIESGDVNVVYRRNHGGVGVIMPEKH